MRGVYTASAAIPSISGTKTLIAIFTPATKPIEILSASITNMDNDTAEQLEAGLFIMPTTGSPAGSSIVPEKHEQGDQSSTVSVLVNLTNEPSSYNSGAVDLKGWNNLGGYYYDPIPEERPVVPVSNGVGLRLMANATTAFKGSVQITYREIG